MEKFRRFSIRRAFKAIDYQNHRVIDEAAMRRFLKRVGHQPIKQELTAIMRRFDLDGDAQISFAEFSEALTPIQPDVIQNPSRHGGVVEKNRESLMNNTIERFNNTSSIEQQYQYREEMRSNDKNDMK